MVGGTSYFSLDSGRVDGESPGVARAFADFAVLYRLSAQSRPLVEAFDRSGIPYQTAGQGPLAADTPVREVLAHLWLTRQPTSRVHLATVLAAGKPAFTGPARTQVAAFIGSATSSPEPDGPAYTRSRNPAEASTPAPGRGLADGVWGRGVCRRLHSGSTHPAQRTGPVLRPTGPRCTGRRTRPAGFQRSSAMNRWAGCRSSFGERQLPASSFRFSCRRSPCTPRPTTTTRAQIVSRC